MNTYTQDVHICIQYVHTKNQRFMNAKSFTFSPGV